jgi:hypothetical protein
MGTTTTRPQKGKLNQEEIAFFFIIRTTDANDERLFHEVRAAQDILSEEVSRLVYGTLGTGFHLRRVEVRRGSTEFWVIVGGAFTLISHYVHFVRSLELFSAQVQDLLRRFLGDRFPEVVITGGRAPMTEVEERRPGFQFRISVELVLFVVVSYLIVTHILLFAFFIHIMRKAYW